MTCETCDMGAADVAQMLLEAKLQQPEGHLHGLKRIGEQQGSLGPTQKMLRRNTSDPSEYVHQKLHCYTQKVADLGGIDQHLVAPEAHHARQLSRQGSMTSNGSLKSSTPSELHPLNQRHAWSQHCDGPMLSQPLGLSTHFAGLSVSGSCHGLTGD